MPFAACTFSFVSFSYTLLETTVCNVVIHLMDLFIAYEALTKKIHNLYGKILRTSAAKKVNADYCTLLSALCKLQDGYDSLPFGFP